MRWATVMLAAVVMLAGGPARADYFECTVVDVLDLTDGGTTRESVWKEKMVGSTFSVNRANGAITGEVLPTDRVIPTDMTVSTKVINSGGGGYSFKAIAEFQSESPGSNQIQVIEIQAFKQSTIKPFIAMSMGGAGLVTGLCIESPS